MSLKKLIVSKDRYSRFAAMLRQAAIDIDNMGTPSQVGLDSEECRAAAAAIEEAAILASARYDTETANLRRLLKASRKRAGRAEALLAEMRTGEPKP